MYTNEEKEVMKTLVQNLRSVRKRNKHSQNVFAEKIDFQREHIAKVETNRRNLTLKYIIRTSLAYNIPITDLFKDV